MTRFERIAPEIIIGAYILAHVLLGWLITWSVHVATVQMLAALLCGLWWSLVSPRLERLAMVAAYIAGGEVIWRMMRAGPFWEFGKYSLILLFGLFLLRTGRLRGPAPALLFFGCLLPSIVLPMANVSNAELRDNLSFYLSGPLALMIATWFFSRTRLREEELQQILYAMIGPTVSLGTVTLVSIISQEKVRFSNNSNMLASGGFGPNQVSAALGLGVLFAFLAWQRRGLNPLLKAGLMIVTLFLISQCALTFSRTGLYLAGGGMVAAAFFLARDRRMFMQLAIGVIALLLAVSLFLLPRLERVTGGLMASRFSNTRLTGRERLIEADLTAFAENPVLGVGPGQAREYRRRVFDASAAHTEFSRLLAEHGLFGILAIMILLWMGAQHILQQHSPKGRGVAAAMICWSFLFMAVSAMRLVAPAFAFGFSAMSLLPEQAHQGMPEQGSLPARSREA